jgi:glycosyltransferase involved in cell wall biosynthesis
MVKRHRALPVGISEKEIVLERGGRFSLTLPEKIAPDFFLVLDIYDLDRPVHPEGHIGWWRYDVGLLSRHPTGRLSIDGSGAVFPTIDGVAAVDEWRNQTTIEAKRLELLIVLRSAITNAILSVDRVPVTYSERDLELFRSGFDRDYRSPRYAPPHYMLSGSRGVHVVSENIFQRDAVGNLCLALYRMLRQHGISVHLFAKQFDLVTNDVIVRRELLVSNVKPEDTVVYFFSTYDNDLDGLLDINCARKIAYFHGITPPNLLQVFDPELSAVCAKATAQMPLLAQFDRLATNSRANAAVLHNRFAADNVRQPPEISVVPPKIAGEQELHMAQPQRSAERPFSPDFIYVGRIKSHKRIEDILYLLAEYRRLDPLARCTIVGLAETPAYSDYLRWVQITQLNLPEDAVRWLGSVSETELARAYDEATVYVSMSEHEGFCVPLVEAMARDVLVFAYDQPAVRETAGMAGVLFNDKSFKNLAKQLQVLLDSPETCRKILQAQRQRASEFLSGMDGRGFLELLAIS